MRRIPLGWSVIIALLGCGLILFAGGNDDATEGTEEWKPLNAEITETLGIQDQNSPISIPGGNNVEQNKEPSASKDKAPVKEEAGEAPSKSDTAANAAPIIDASTPAAPEILSQEKDEKPAPIDTSGKININTADISGLMELPGIGEKKAQAIIDYRTKNGSFRSVAELMDVKGIGPKMLEKMKSYVSL